MRAHIIVLLSGLSAACAKLHTIYSSDEVKSCGGFISKGPNFAVGGGKVYSVNGCGSGLKSNRTVEEGRLGDSVSGHTIVFKSSSDGGKTWGNFQKISGKGSIYGGSKIIYDRQHDKLIVQFMRFPSGESSETAGATLFQRTSSDGGATWTTKRNITSMIDACDHNSGPPRGVAGSRIQTPSGRIIFGGFGYNGQRCIWYSDDGGETYRTQGLQEKSTNEWSMAVAGGTGQLIINSRKNGDSGFGDYRVNVFSHDDGVTWSAPEQSPWKDAVNNNNHGCEASMETIGDKLFFFNPTGTGKSARTKMVVRCSTDGGKTTESGKYKITETDEGGYSGMADIGGGNLLLGWGYTDTDGNRNIYVKQIGTDWCSSAVSV